MLACQMKIEVAQRAHIRQQSGIQGPKRALFWDGPDTTSYNLQASIFCKSNTSYYIIKRPARPLELQNRILGTKFLCLMQNIDKK